MRCLKCGYRVRGLTGPSCPECQHPFDPHDPTTYLIENQPRLLTRGNVVLGLTAAGCSLVGGAVTLAGFAEPAVAFLGVLILLYAAGPLATIWLALLVNWYFTRRRFLD